MRIFGFTIIRTSVLARRDVILKSERDEAEDELKRALERYDKAEKTIGDLRFFNKGLNMKITKLKQISDTFERNMWKLEEERAKLLVELSRLQSQAEKLPARDSKGRFIKKEVCSDERCT